MAKKVYTHDRDARGQVQVLEVHKPKGAQKKSAAAGPIPWTAAPTTVAGKLKRAWIG
jgi:hypothetical protein